MIPISVDVIVQLQHSKQGQWIFLNNLRAHEKEASNWPWLISVGLWTPHPPHHPFPPSPIKDNLLAKIIKVQVLVSCKLIL